MTEQSQATDAQQYTAQAVAHAEIAENYRASGSPERAELTALAQVYATCALAENVARLIARLDTFGEALASVRIRSRRPGEGE